MQMIRLFLDVTGRIGRGWFWIAWAFLTVTSLVLLAASHAPGVWLLTLYPYVVVFSKRLRDMGRSPLWQLVPWLIWVGAIGTFVHLLDRSLKAAGLSSAFGDTHLFMQSPTGMIVLFCPAIIWLGFVAWLGSSPSRVATRT